MNMPFGINDSIDGMPDSVNKFKIDRHNFRRIADADRQTPGVLALPEATLLPRLPALQIRVHGATHYSRPMSARTHARPQVRVLRSHLTERRCLAHRNLRPSL